MTKPVALGGSSGTGTVTASGGALTSNAVVLGNGTTDTKVSTGITTNGASELDLGVVGTSGVLGLKGSTSGTATLTAPAVAGTTTNFVLSSNSLTAPVLSASDGTQALPAFTRTGHPDTGWYFVGSSIVYSAGNTDTLVIGGTPTVRGASNLTYAWTPTNSANSADTALSRSAAGIVAVGNGTAGDFSGLLRSGNRVSVGTSDFTSANSAALQAITGLSITFPALAANFSFHCVLMYSQATASAGDQFGVGVITTAPTNVNVAGRAYTSTGAASAEATGTLNGLASTTPTSVVTFTPAVNATIYNAYLDGTVELAGGGAATLNIYVLNGTAANVIIIKRGSYLMIY